MKSTTTGTSNPFPGLRPFREDEEHLFFGRESQVDTMIDKLVRTRFLAVLGTSGSGKSSLVNCGLRPGLHRGLMANAGASWRMAQFRPGSDPLRAMAHALAKEGVLFRGFQLGSLTLEDMVEASLRMSKLGLTDVYEQARLSETVNLLVVVDQFEELFRYRILGAAVAGDRQGRSQEAVAFVNLLLESKAQANLPVYIVLTMRSDFLGDCAGFPGLPEAINEGLYLLPRLTREERRAAITGPVAVAHGEISPVLLTRLVNDVGDNPDQLSILQHALNRTWAQWQHDGAGHGRLDLPHYEAIGTMAHALDQHAEEAYEELGTEPQKKICQKIFKALTDKGTDARGTRRPIRLATLSALTGATSAEVTQVINVFREPGRSFLMPPLLEELGADTVIDISHESLMRVWERLKVWAEEEAQSARLYRRLSETAALHAENKAGLLREPELQLALGWRKSEMPTEGWTALYGGGFELAMSFLGESEAQLEREVREKQERERRELEFEKTRAIAQEQELRLAIQLKSTRRLRVLLVASTVIFLVAVLFGYWAWQRGIVIDYAQKQAMLQVENARQTQSQASEWLALSNGNAKRAQAAVDQALAQNPQLATILPRISIQVLDDYQIGYAKEIGKKLGDAGFVILGIELVQSPTVLWTSEVRYHNKADEAVAIKILQVMQDAGDTSAKTIYSDVGDSPKVSSNKFEVWLSDVCREGYVWREARPDDHVCVSPEIHAQTVYDNSQAAVRRAPGGGAYGPDTCVQGYVWRGAFPNDHVCVIPAARDQALNDNLQAQNRLVGRQ